jgi:hypothetical protein
MQLAHRAGRTRQGYGTALPGERCERRSHELSNALGVLKEGALLPEGILFAGLWARFLNLASLEGNHVKPVAAVDQSTTLRIELLSRLLP